MKKKSVWNLMVILMVMGGLSLSGCSKECTYTYQKSGTDNTIAKYSYSFKYPTITLTSINDDKEVITGTIASYPFKADDITFKNSKDEAVWMQMIRKK